MNPAMEVAKPTKRRPVNRKAGSRLRVTPSGAWRKRARARRIPGQNGRSATHRFRAHNRVAVPAAPRALRGQWHRKPAVAGSRRGRRRGRIQCKRMVSNMNKVKSRAASAAFAAAIAAAGMTGCGSDTELPAVQSMTVFGDSLSDVGTYAGATNDPNNLGKFTVNPGNVWVENIAAGYGLKLTPNRRLTLDKDASGVPTAGVGTATTIGGNGYAEGGARIAQYPMQSGVGNNAIVSSVSDQVGRYLAANANRVPAGQLIVIGGGGNDTYAQFADLCWHYDNNGLGVGKTTIAIATDAVATAARAQVDNVKRLRAAGAQAVLVYQAGDWSSNPFARKYLSDVYQAVGCFVPVPASQITQWTRQFNQILADGIKGLAGVALFDAGAPLKAAIADPAAYGFANVTAPGCNNTVPTTSAAFCTRATLVEPNADQTYLWSDAFHPTPHGHKLISDSALQALKTIVQ